MAQLSEPVRTFGHAFLHTGRFVKVFRLSPQPSCHSDRPRILFENGQRSERVRQLARRRFLVAAIDCDRLV